MLTAPAPARVTPPPAPGIRWTPTFTASPRTYAPGTFGLTDAERVAYLAHLRRKVLAGGEA
jgi:hypothetical protein